MTARSLDHTGPHGRCAVDDCPDRTCPDPRFMPGRGWLCDCCDGDLAFGGLEAADTTIYAIFRRRVLTAMAKNDSPVRMPLRVAPRPD